MALLTSELSQLEVEPLDRIVGISPQDKHLETLRKSICSILPA